jgi:hypothetical protein
MSKRTPIVIITIAILLALMVGCVGAVSYNEIINNPSITTETKEKLSQMNIPDYDSLNEDVLNWLNPRVVKKQTVETVKGNTPNVRIINGRVVIDKTKLRVDNSIITDKNTNNTEVVSIVDSKIKYAAYVNGAENKKNFEFISNGNIVTVVIGDGK